MKFKNQTDLNELETESPPKNFIGRDLNAFRWTFDTINHPDNFKSQYHKKPSRFKKSTSSKKCIAMSLSMFNSMENAKSRFLILKESMGEFAAYETLGTHIAEGNLNKTDGVTSMADKRGHFSYFPSEETDVAKKFSINKKL